jgi:hypothetical protein
VEMIPAPSTGMMGIKKRPMEKSKTNDAIASRVLKLLVLPWGRSQWFTCVISVIAKKKPIAQDSIEEHVQN